MKQRAAEQSAVSALFRGSACQVHRCSNYPGTIWPTAMENMILEIEISWQEKVFNQLATAGQSKKPRFSLCLFLLGLLFFPLAPAMLLAVWHPWELLAVNEFISWKMPKVSVGNIIHNCSISDRKELARRKRTKNQVLRLGWLNGQTMYITQHSTFHMCSFAKAVSA